MNVGCFLPPKFEDFCSVLGAGNISTEFSEIYAGIQVAERRNEWVVDRLIDLAVRITESEDYYIFKAMAEKLDTDYVLEHSYDVYSFKKNLWFLKCLTDERIENEPFCRGRWNKIKLRFREFNQARKSGKEIESRKKKLLNLIKTVEAQFGPDTKKLVIKLHNEKLAKRKDLARKIFPYNIVDVFNRVQAGQKSNSEVISGARVKIGLGVQSTFKPKKISRDSVVLDDKTTSRDKVDKHILYPAGWSMKQEGD
ncbi:hypothetical protein AO073_01665 [Pseudomonas syringae ICMP 11293]|uniref:hypothetical protein n=1 Tax=Pseudomonas syringae TaxID=317 RepID=UPI0007300201|nr:hypothetical protein [Pseudomonas syringae]KTB91607.1 hypothetical protein AO073_01665 [Pseudomonas syringae ICMP 11293]